MHESDFVLIDPSQSLAVLLWSQFDTREMESVLRNCTNPDPVPGPWTMDTSVNQHSSS